MTPPEKQRLDVLLVERGLADTRTKAAALILAGQVVVGDNRVDKPGTRVPLDAAVRLKGPGHPFVSRGGLKLRHALETFEVSVTGLVALDAGASTGGFTDCLLQRGLARCHAVDVGHGQLHERLRRDPRVRPQEGLNLRMLRPADLAEPVDLVVGDLSFISLTLVLPALEAVLKPGGRMLLLVKPQFEVGRDQVGRGGIVRDASARDRAVQGVVAKAASLGLLLRGQVQAEPPGADGNLEFFVLLEKPKPDCERPG